MTFHTKDKFYSELISINNTMVYDFQINEKSQLEDEYICTTQKFWMILQVYTNQTKPLDSSGFLKVKDLVFEQGQKGYNRKVYDLIQEIKTHLPKSQDRQPEQAGKENSVLYLSPGGGGGGGVNEKPTCDISIKQIYIKLQSRVSINTPYQDNVMCNLCAGETKAHCHEILSCKTMLYIVDHFRPIIPAIDSKIISRRELIFGLTLGDKSMNLRIMIIFTIRSCVHRSRNVQFTSINNAKSKLINKVKAQLSRVMWDNYNLALQKNVSGNFEQTCPHWESSR